MERLYLKNIGFLIERKDMRTIRKWCKDSNLIVFKDTSGEFVYKSEFDLAFDLPLIEALKVRFGELWKEHYELRRRGELYKNLTISSTLENKIYMPKGTISSKFFEKVRK